MAEAILLKDEVYKITGCAMPVLNALGHGFNEKVYENSLAIEMSLQAIRFSKQKEFNISYRDEIVGTYVPDFIVDDQVVVELKTIDRITDIEKGQIANYLRVANLKVGLILNFKNPKLEWQRVVL